MKPRNHKRNCRCVGCSPATRKKGLKALRKAAKSGRRRAKKNPVFGRRRAARVPTATIQAFGNGFSVDVEGSRLGRFDTLADALDALYTDWQV